MKSRKVCFVTASSAVDMMAGECWVVRGEVDTLAIASKSIETMSSEFSQHLDSVYAGTNLVKSTSLNCIQTPRHDVQKYLHTPA